jgi:hypothetical protein
MTFVAVPGALSENPARPAGAAPGNGGDPSVATPPGEQGVARVGASGIETGGGAGTGSGTGAGEDKPKKRRSKHDVEGRVFKCTLCAKTYLSYAALYTHTKTKHVTGQPIHLGKPKSRGRPKKVQPLSSMHRPRVPFRKHSSFPTATSPKVEAPPRCP